jgi:hypothetical protein
MTNEEALAIVEKALRKQRLSARTKVSLINQRAELLKKISGEEARRGRPPGAKEQPVLPASEKDPVESAYGAAADANPDLAHEQLVAIARGLPCPEVEMIYRLGITLCDGSRVVIEAADTGQLVNRIREARRLEAHLRRPVKAAAPAQPEAIADVE